MDRGRSRSPGPLSLQILPDVENVVIVCDSPPADVDSRLPSSGVEFQGRVLSQERDPKDEPPRGRGRKIP